MKKILRLENLECADCASKMERAVSKIDGVDQVSVNFVTQKMTLEVDEALFGKIAEEAAKVCKRIEPDCRIVI